MKYFCAAVVTLVVLTTPLLSSAEIPGADDPKSYTSLQYNRDEVAYNRRTMVDAYLKVGFREEDWNDLALDFLEDRAVAMAYAGADRYSMDDSVPNILDEQKTAQDLLNLDCDDPLVLDLIGLVLSDRRDPRGAGLIRQAAEALARSQYPAFRIANSVRRAQRNMNKDDPDQPRFTQMLIDANLRSLQGELTPFDRRKIWDGVREDVERWPIDQQKSFYERARKEQGDPWLVNMIGGTYHVNVGWKARGTGFASTVTEEGRETLAREMAEARKCFVKADKLQPTLPEAPAEMISVVMTESDTPPNESLRYWFDRAVSRQFDFEPAYRRYSYAIEPRWHGSIEEMYDLAVECAQTKRFDTSVPYRYLKILADIGTQSGSSLGYWSRPGVYEHARDVLNGYAEEPRQKKSREYFLSQLVGFAWQMTKYEDGRAALNATGGKFDVWGFDASMTIAQRSVSGTYAMTGPRAARYKEAEAKLAAKQLDDAIAAYEAIVKTVPANDPDRDLHWARGRAQELRWQKQFDTGEWVNLIPDSTMAGWNIDFGNLTSDGSTLTGTMGQTSARAVVGNRFGQRWEMSGMVESLPSKAHPGRRTYAGPMFCRASNELYYATIMRPDSQRIGWVPNGKGLYGYDAKNLESKNAFVVQQWDETIEVLINGEPFLDSMHIRSVGRRIENRVGIYSDAINSLGDEFKVTDLKIRKLTAPPANLKLKKQEN